MIKKTFVKLLLFVVVLSSVSTISATEKPETIKIGFIGSLTGFAAAYGNEALNGARLAIEENSTHSNIQLVVEDDASDVKNGLSSFEKLVSVDRVSAIITGTWWANSIVKPAEARGIPLISVETSFNKDSVSGESYFIMQGYLRDWVNVYEPLIQKKNWRRGAIIHFTSGFGQTLAEEMKKIFSYQDRELVADLEYSDLNISEVRSLVLKLKSIKPDVLYFDGQPQSLAMTIKRLREVGMATLPIITNSIAEDMCQNNLFDCKIIDSLYFSKRGEIGIDFSPKYQARYQKSPYLNSDLAYHGARMLIDVLAKSDPVNYIKESMFEVDGVKFRFDDKNVLQGIKHQIWEVQSGELVKLDL
ncbi:MAG TPA: ABC transporter substrate-binding protein [Oligoflexia bacterium]|nr:ABC transporter substrate-binding protein [Oligoflexia bacterium]HMP47138.1 ABC transporter substrate-binding protein [Oligoflexia bacterium]